MKRTEIKRILIPVDFSTTGQLALEHGAFIARLYKAELVLLHVIEMLEYSYTIYEPSSIALIDNEMEKNVKDTLSEQARAISQEYGIEVTPLVTIGRVSSEIEEVAKEKSIDLIVMGTHGATGFEEFLIGSNANKIASNSPCPVISIQAHTAHAGFTNIVMPIDNSMGSRQKVDHVINLAKLFGSFVHFLGIESEDDGKTDEKKFMIKIESVEKALMKESIPFKLTLVKGENVAKAVMKFSEEVHADLIVIMSDHESHISFSKQIVNHSLIPVMSITPMKVNYESVSMSASSNPFA